MENKYSFYHFGVKGMRWGRRKVKADSNLSGKKRSTGSKVTKIALATIGTIAAVKVAPKVLTAGKLAVDTILLRAMTM